MLHNETEKHTHGIFACVWLNINTFLTLSCNVFLRSVCALKIYFNVFVKTSMKKTTLLWTIYKKKIPGQFLTQIEEQKQVLRQCNWHWCNRMTLRPLHSKQHENGHLKTKSKAIERGLFLQTFRVHKQVTKFNYKNRIIFKGVCIQHNVQIYV